MAHESKDPFRFFPAYVLAETFFQHYFPLLHNMTNF